MQLHLSDVHMQLLHKTLNAIIPDAEAEVTDEKRPDYVQIFLAAKRVEGCSDKTTRYYESTVRNVITAINKSPERTTTDDTRLYIDEKNVNRSPFKKVHLGLSNPSLLIKLGLIKCVKKSRLSKDCWIPVSLLI